MKKIVLQPLLILMIAVMFEACKPKPEQPAESPTSDSTDTAEGTINRSPFGTLPDGTEVSLYTLKNSAGTEMLVTNYGGIITALKTADKNGTIEDIVLGYDSLAGYLKAPSFFGALVGRYGNRIAKGKFTLDGQTYSLVLNNGVNHLHGGTKGFDKVVWNADAYSTPEGPTLKLTYVSKDMEEGYPGNLQVEVVYTLTNDNALKINYTATTDKKTVINLTNHSYFNLSGNTKRDIQDHTLTLTGSKFLPVDKTLIPTGEIKSVKGTPFDFTSPKVIGERIDAKDQQIEFGMGYDHCWVVDKPDGVTAFATVYDSISGRVLEAFTTEPGVQFYSGNFLDGIVTGKFNTVYKKRYGLCLETQHFPDSPNKPSFPPTVLNPGEVYKTQTIYKFSTR